MTIRIQPAMRANMQLPYPFFIEEDGSVGRQDFWKGEPESLVGFQAMIDRQQIDLELGDFIDDPERAVGMYPVFEDSVEKGRSFWALTDKISSVAVEGEK